MKKYFHLKKDITANGEAVTYLDLWKKAQSEGYEGFSIDAEAILTKSADDENTFHAIFSSAREDRHYDVVKQEFDLSSFKKNPVFLDSHNYDSITAIIGRVKRISVVDNKLQGDIEFALMNPRGVLAYEMAKEGFINTTSIGFIPKEFSDKGEILKSELLEISAVSVPANADALFVRSTDGADTKGKKKEDETPAPVADPEPAPAPEPAKPPVNHVGNVIEKMNRESRQTLAQIASAVEKMANENRYQQKREVLKAIRSLM